MKNEQLASFIASCQGMVTYIPRQTEVDFTQFISLPRSAAVYRIQPDASLEPALEASRAANIAGGRRTAILIPGRRFDATGTRHGKGAGWYDRFLAQAPSAWVRIGFCWDDQFSTEPLVRQSWDEPMDYLVVVPRSGGDPQIYETQARA